MLSACLLPHCCVYLTLLCLTGDLHRDSRHAALWCVLHGLSLHNGEQQQQRYCLNRFSSWSVFANLATSSPFFFFPSPPPHGLLCLARFFLPIYFVLSVFPFLSPLFSLFCQTSPPEMWRKSLSCLSHSHLVPDPSCPHSHPKLTWRATVTSV